MKLTMTASAHNKRIVLEQIGFQIAPKLNLAVRDSLKEPIKELVIEVIKEHPIYRGIMGRFAGNEEMDVQAHMGLTDDLKDLFDEEFTDLLSQFLKVQRSQQSLLGIDILLPEKDKIVAEISSGAYLSDTSLIEIPWLEWLLDGVGPIDAAILYGAHKSGQDLLGSRSGRAIMVKPGGELGPWSTASYKFGQKNNFIEQAFNSSKFSNKLGVIVRKAYEDQIKKLK